MTKLNDSRRGNRGQEWTMGKCDILISVGLGLPLLVVFLVYRYSRSLRSLSRGTARPPPGKFWQLPWIGESIQLLTSTPDNFVLPRLKKYGKIFRTHLFGQPAICITNPEAAKFVLQSPELFDVNWPESVKTLLGVDGIVHAQGELHARYRRLIANSINPAVLRKFTEDIDRAATEQAPEWGDCAVIHTLDELRKYTFRVVLLFSCDSLPSNVDISPHATCEHIRKSFRRMEDALLAIPINIPGSRYNRALKEREKIVKFIDQLIKQRREESVPHPDLLGSFLNSVEHGHKLSDKQVIDNILTVFFTGHDSTAFALVWVLHNLILYPNVLQLVKAENDALAKERNHVADPIAWDDLRKLPFTLQVIQETLRMASITPNIMREAKDDVIFEGMLIPKGWKVIVWMKYLHLDPELHPDPLKFNPSRFETVPKANSYIPFGNGPRVCPGSELAKQEMLIFMHRLVTTYDFEPVGKLNRKVTYWPLPHPHDGLPLKITKRSLS